MSGLFLWPVTAAPAEEIGRGGVYSVLEIEFSGPTPGPGEAPARDIDLRVLFRHEAGGLETAVHGFWDGDGKGGMKGSVFRVRFCPTRAGRGTLAEVRSNRKELAGEHQGDFLVAEPSGRHGFWIADPESAGRRWFRRSDGSHQFIFGNTQYSFLSGYEKGGKPSGTDIRKDIIENARYFKKLRFGLSGDYYPDPVEKPFLDDRGQQTDRGDDSHRPNPSWFHRRVDLAVRTAFQEDLIADLILAGPDQETSRSTLRAGKNGGDATPFLKYIAARYGSYPNVWICLCNEYDIRKPRYSEERIAELGRTIRRFLPHPTPLSVHATPRKLWSEKFDALPPWNSHQIIQKKIRRLAPAADVIQRVWKNPGGKERRKPTIDDELSYTGKGDHHSEGDTIESHLGAFLGGGYGTTGEKPGSKEGQYFRGNFDPAEHRAADNLKWLREVIDSRISFWKMSPDLEIFSNLHPEFRGMSRPGREYVLGTNRFHEGLAARLPEGAWEVTRYDVVKMESRVLSGEARGRFTFQAPESRAVLFHFRKLEK